VDPTGDCDCAKECDSGNSAAAVQMRASRVGRFMRKYK
jgi:hypothetical protein